ncbi:MAG: hypothetical protein U1F51_20635 [Burkholderiales bacterium]
MKVEIPAFLVPPASQGRVQRSCTTARTLTLRVRREGGSAMNRNDLEGAMARGGELTSGRPIGRGAPR